MVTEREWIVKEIAPTVKGSTLGVHDDLQYP